VTTVSLLFGHTSYTIFISNKPSCDFSYEFAPLCRCFADRIRFTIKFLPSPLFDKALITVAESNLVASVTRE